MSRLQGVSTTENLPAYSNCASAWSGSVAWASSAAYTTANQLSSLTRFIGVVQSCPSGDVFNTTSEIFRYNVNNQLTDIETGTAVGGIPYQSTLKDGSNYILAGYHYSATQNNGQITSMDDGRQEYSVTYQYDLLKRLVSATAGSNWTQTFGYDGFGNLTSKSTPSGSSELPLPGVNAAKNWLTGYTYDANGNVGSYNNYSLGYDPVNRLSYATTGSFIETYAYDASNHRIERINSSLDTVYFFSPSGALLSEFNCLSTCTLIYNRIYFGGMVLGTDGAGVYGNPPSALGDVSTWTDRLGSAQSTYPYGTDIGSYPADADAVDFATYTKEGSTGLEYAMNRYYSGGLGRFPTPDLTGKGIDPANPQTWSGFTYASRDPINRFDPTGKDDAPPFFCGLGDPTDGSWDCSNILNLIALPIAVGLFDEFFQHHGKGSIPDPTVVTSNSKSVLSLFDSAFKDAWKILQRNQSCANLFDPGGGTSAASADQGVLASTLYAITPFPAAQSGVGAQKISRTVVDINLKGAMFTATPSSMGQVTITVPTPSGRLVPVTLGSQSDLGAFVILHELGHQVGVFPPDKTPSINGQNSWAVLTDCFGLRVP